jgi:hypothetical protein
MENTMQTLPGGKNRVGNRLGTRELAHDVRGRRQFLYFSDSQIIGIVGHGVSFLGVGARRRHEKSRQIAGGFSGDSGRP